jgi:hypothetical protein
MAPIKSRPFNLLGEMFLNLVINALLKLALTMRLAHWFAGATSHSRSKGWTPSGSLALTKG